MFCKYKKLEKSTIAAQIKDEIRNWHALDGGPLGEVVGNGRYFFARKRMPDLKHLNGEVQ